eukprot:COSAG06_NODE_51711_length_310_cov_0.971564_2_plen_28_part_01
MTNASYIVIGFAKDSPLRQHYLANCLWL